MAKGTLCYCVSEHFLESPLLFLENLAHWFVLQVKVGPLSVSPMGFGTWAWGNQLLWGYEESMDTQLQQTFNFAVQNGINLFDTADSYGTGKLNGQSEKLLGKFIRQFQGHSAQFPHFSFLHYAKTVPPLECVLENPVILLF